MAVAHSILVTAYHMLRHQQHYKELGGDFFDVINRDKVRDRLVQRLTKLGFDVTLKTKETVESRQNDQAVVPAVTETPSAT